MIRRIKKLENLKKTISQNIASKKIVEKYNDDLKVKNIPDSVKECLKIDEKTAGGVLRPYIQKVISTDDYYQKLVWYVEEATV